MRGDLQKLPTVSDIQTDFKTNIATFKIADPKMDKAALKAKLDEFAAKNKHMKDWSFMEEGSDASK